MQMVTNNLEFGKTEHTIEPTLDSKLYPQGNLIMIIEGQKYQSITGQR